MSIPICSHRYIHADTNPTPYRLAFSEIEDRDPFAADSLHHTLRDQR